MSSPMLPRVARWLLKLLEFDYDIIHRAGDNMRHVDAISRAPITDQSIVEDVSAKIMKIDDGNWVSSLQRQDPDIREKMEILTGLILSENCKQLEKTYCIQNNRLFKKWGSQLLLVVPKGIRWRVLNMCHDDMGHPGIDGTMKRVLKNFWFPRLRNYAKGYVKSCVECNYHREPQIKNCELHGMEIPKLPFDTIHMDHLGPFVRSKRGNEYVLVVVDALTRYAIVVPTRSTKSKPVIDAMLQLTLYFGLPRVVVTDRGTAFTSTMFEKFCQDNSIKHIRVAVRTPRANGLAERMNRSIIEFLKTAVHKERDWDLNVREMQWALNTKINSTTKAAPIDLIFDFPLKDISGNKLLAAIQDDTSVLMNERREGVALNIAKAREKWKARFDSKHQKPMKFNEGDLVVIEAPPVATGQSRKLQAAYKGPYIITKILRFDRYLIENVETAQGLKRHFSTVVASDKMKPWCALYPELDNQNISETDDELDDSHGSELGTSFL